VTDRLACWHAAALWEKALGIAQTETLPDLNEARIVDLKRRTVRRTEDA
jgi:hypothetical protein